MIYLITGVPGSGKTLYAVSTLVKKLLSEKPKGPDGTEIERRLLVDGIPDLLLPHEVLPPMVEDDKKSDNWTCDGDGLLTWPSWCKPGDLIVIDEVQRYWRPRGMGTKPPEMIKALETHRHLGVDFIIITQNPMLIDQNVRRLVGRHQHVRRLFGMARAIIYDWDACSVDVNRTKSATTSTWGYPKAAYNLYKSSALHLKQRQKVPLWLLVPILAIVGLVAVSPKAFSTMSGAMTGKGISSASAPLPAASAPVTATPVTAAASAPAAVASASAISQNQGPSVEEIPPEKLAAGCFAFAKKCVCTDTRGAALDVEPGFCEAQILGNSIPGQKANITNLEFSEHQVERVIPSPWTETDHDVLAFMRKRSSS